MDVMTPEHDTPEHDTPEHASPEHTTPELDVLVAGGGAAGLAAAVTLARSRRSVTVVDSGRPRNAPAEGVHALLGREGISPAELLAAGRREVLGYGAEVVDGEIAAVRRLADGRFQATLAGG